METEDSPQATDFLLLAYHDKISSNEQRAKRNLTADPSYGICGWTSESVLHILRDFPRAQSIWNNVLTHSPSTLFFHANLKAWIYSNLLSKTSWSAVARALAKAKGNVLRIFAYLLLEDKILGLPRLLLRVTTCTWVYATAGMPWSIGFVFTCWYIWKWRNQYVFNEEEPLPFSPLIVILNAAREWFSNAYALQSKTLKTQVPLAWEPLAVGGFKLKVDRSRISSNGAIGAGGVIRNSLGDWVTGFTVNLGKGQILDVEIWGLFFGLKLAAERGISNLVVEMDSATAVHLLQRSETPSFHPLPGVLSDCRKFVEQLGNCGVNHVYREQNCVADSLAQASYNGDLGVWPLDSAPAWIGTLLADDVMGVSKTRWILF
ncbi:unnamed protein product [Prunus armeniaca]